MIRPAVWSLALFALAQLSWAADPTPAKADISGFWMLASEPFTPDPELVSRVPRDTVGWKDTGAAEFGLMNFGGLKLKPAAMEAAKQWKPEQEMTVSNTCRIPSIVYALQGPFPIEIFQGTEMTVMRMEYYDMTRVIFTDGRDPWPAGEGPHTKTGYSLGHWEGDLLVVDTTHLKEATITNNGLEHSDQMRVTERFKLTDGGRMLQASQEYDDPAVLENRGVRYIAWRRVEGDHVHAYDCDPSFSENYSAD